MGWLQMAQQKKGERAAAQNLFYWLVALLRLVATSESC
jgi:hypothetical protein